MGELILCRQSIAATPYYIEEASLNVYSLEELSYYIFHNAYLMNSDFMSMELCQWIDDELHENELFMDLRELLSDNVPLHIFVNRLLLSNSYLTLQEVKETVEILSAIENKSDYERRKLRADRLFTKGKVVDAVFEYEHILNENKNEALPQEFCGDVWHNLGTAYARLLFFNEAAYCFDMAYQRNRREYSLTALLMAYRCAKEDEKLQSVLLKYHVSKEKMLQIENSVRVSSNDVSIREFDAKLDEISQKSVNDETFYQHIDAVILKWKKQYTKLCRI